MRMAGEERFELISTARALTVALSQVSRQVNEIINRLHSEADQFLTAAADEQQTGTVVGRITYGQPRASHPRESGKRACSICHQPGHRKTTCPDANKAYKAERGKK